MHDSRPTLPNRRRRTVRSSSAVPSRTRRGRAFGPDGTLVAGGVEEQTRQVLDNVERCLASAGCSMDDVVKVTAFLSDLEDFDAYNRVYEQRFAAPYPARSTVGARLADGLLVEIEAVALLPRVG